MALSIRVHTRSSKGQYVPATLTSDIARIVDPTYTFGHGSSSAASSPTAATVALQPKAYVDQSGDMHDPDYRAFPALPSRTSSRRPSSPGHYPSFGYYDDEDDEEVAAGARWLAARSRPTSSSSSRPEPVNFYHRASFEESVLFEDLPEAEASSPLETATKSSGQSSPTSCHGIRYQFHAIQLDLRLKVVRAKRRWRERRNSDAPH